MAVGVLSFMNGLRPLPPEKYFWSLETGIDLCVAPGLHQAHQAVRQLYMPAPL